MKTSKELFSYEDDVEEAEERLSSDGIEISSLSKSSIKKPTTHQKGKKLQVQQTIIWLDENYTVCEGVCLPRCILYAHYLDFCRNRKYTPSCAATFGKTIRQKFPRLTTRRLGTRGHSKYHYYGIAIKDTSAYYHTVYSGKGLTRFSGLKLENDENYIHHLSMTTKTGTLLPEFPDPNNLTFSSHINSNKLETFLLMYKTHCQCILDTTISASYIEIRHFIVHFWKGMPHHLATLFEQDEVIDLVCICDSILYKVLTDVLVPISLQDVNEESLSEVRHFSRQLEPWLMEAICFDAEKLKSRKLEVLRRFVQSVKRQTSFLHLAKTTRSALANETVVQQLLHDLNQVDITSMTTMAQYTTFDSSCDQVELHEGYLRELKELLSEDGTIETYMEWLEYLVQAQVIQDQQEPNESLKERAQEFLLSWSYFGARITHSLTINTAKAFGTFHLIRLFLDEYILLILESQICKDEENELQGRLDKLWCAKGENDSPGIKVSVVITRTKFGAPSPSQLLKKKSTITTTSSNPITKKTKRRQRDDDEPIILSSMNNNNNFTRKYDGSTIWNDHNRLHRSCIDNNGMFLPYHANVLTPPISPDLNWSPATQINSLENQSTVLQDISSTRNAINHVPAATSNMVDEHFRNCGYDLYQDNTTQSNIQQNRAQTFGHQTFQNVSMASLLCSGDDASGMEIASIVDAIAGEQASFSTMSTNPYPFGHDMTSYPMDCNESMVLSSFQTPALPSISSLLVNNQ